MLFETKIHGLHEQKKRELEAVLRDFAANLDVSPDILSLRAKKASFHKRDHVYLGSRAQLSHTSSSPGSNRSRPTMGSAESPTQKMETFLTDIPDGLYPQDVIMTDKERKDLVVHRLEQLFTGNISGRLKLKKPPMRPGGRFVVGTDTQTTRSSTAYEALTLGSEPAREANILSLEQGSQLLGNRSCSGAHGLPSNPTEDHMDTGGSDTDLAPPVPHLPEQRPTQARDLDPDRTQIPSENMKYIRHLGLMPPELLPQQPSIQDAHPDAQGWVYLNLLCNMAQIHMISVTPNLVRSAVSELSTKFQLSPDGSKIRWRGGFEGTNFSSDKSGYNLLRSPSIDNLDGSEKKHRRHKTGHSSDDELQCGSSSKDVPQLAPQLCVPFESFQYKPLFLQQDSSGGYSSLEGTHVSLEPAEGGNPCKSSCGPNSFGRPTHKKQRHGGVAIFYTGAPFYTDLSGDPSDVSATAHTLLSGQTQKDPQESSEFARSPQITMSGSFINYNPLTDRGQALHQQCSDMNEDNDGARGLTSDEGEHLSDIGLDLIWNNDRQHIEYQTLEPCGLGGVLPEDHFVVVVDTKRPKQDILLSTSKCQSGRSIDSTEGTFSQPATMPASCLGQSSKRKSNEEPRPVEIEYLSERTERLAPASLPSPATFFPPFSNDDSTSDQDDDEPSEMDHIRS